ncbi:universal stress protein YxiE-like isoform X2 [Haliotis rufescens]|uniref:universal stress protein YxiE-like isoform X2 n=1 Tax=Haliotis rufescens TaxID=6454 RepID=UPI00201F64EC|nr:universal stress protein YxiE-like isoform X2 [Haliotis rufescens]
MATAHELHTHENDAVSKGSRIVAVAIDGSTHSAYALDSLFKFNKQNLATLMDEQVEKVNKDLHAAREKMRNRNVKGKVRAMFSSNVGHAICHAAEEEKAVFIIMGNRGHSMLRRTVTGSISNYVINHSKIPVMVCRQNH